jgi:acyl carrier protein
VPQPTDVEAWMVSYLAELLEIPPGEVGLTVPFENFGLDSVAIVSMTADLSKWLGFELKSDLLFEYPDIRSAADHIGQAKASRSG